MSVASPTARSIVVGTLVVLALAGCSATHHAASPPLSQPVSPSTTARTVVPRSLPVAPRPVRRLAQVTHDRTVYAFGSASFLGSPETLAAPIVGIAQTPTGNGYWLVGRDGGVFGFGAPFYGSLGRPRARGAIVGMAATPTGRGYWLAGSDGGVFSFGDARFYGSEARTSLAAPVRAIVAAPRGGGYWLLARDGGVFAFGAARFYGTARSRAAIVGMAATPTGRGYWLAGSDGGVFAFGDARFLGSAAALPLHSPVASIDGNGAGTGYWLAARDGGVFAFGASRFRGRATAQLSAGRDVAQIVGMPDSAGYRLLAVGTAAAAHRSFVAVQVPSVPRSPAAATSTAPVPSPAAAAPSPAPSTRVTPPSGGVYAIGDSVMIDAAPALRGAIPGIVVNATVSRQVSSGIAVMSQLAASGQLPGTVVWHLGTNGTFSPAALDQVLQIAGGRHVIMLTDHCGYCSWTPGNNATIAAGCTATRHCTVADWNALANANPGWFGSDGVHMAIGGTGAHAYAQLVASKL